MRESVCVIVLLMFLSNVLIGNASSVANVDLIDSRSYTVAILQKTINRIENNHWCNLEVDNVYLNISENVVSTMMNGTVEFTKGFLVSLEKIDIIDNTIQRVFIPVRGNTTTVDIRATVRMLNFVIGFDVFAIMDDGEFLTTGAMRYSELRLPFVISKNLFTDDITVTVSSQLMLNHRSNFMEFSPENKVTRALSFLFGYQLLESSFQRWATEIFAPITQDLADNEIEFPRMNYNTLSPS